MKEGWVCPKCGSVYAPWVPSCRRCNVKPALATFSGVPGTSSAAGGSWGLSGGAHPEVQHGD